MGFLTSLLQIVLPILANWLYKLIEKEVKEVLKERDKQKDYEKVTEQEIEDVLNRLERAKTREHKIKEAERILNGLRSE